MLTRTELLQRLRREVGPHIYELCMDRQNLVDDAIEESLLLYSEFYPELIQLLVTNDMSVPWRDAKGRIYKYGKYKIPLQFPGTREQIRYIGIHGYNIFGNDTSDTYSGRGNLFLETVSKIALSQLPGNRSPFTLRFEQPDVLILDPAATYAFRQSFTVTMKAVKRLDQVHYEMARYFKMAFIGWMKKLIYHEFKNISGDQAYGGVEIDLKIDNYESEGEELIKEVTEIFEQDFMYNPEMFDAINLYSHKG